MPASPSNSSCKMCGSSGPLVKSHILPESLYPHRVTGIADMKLYSRDPAAFFKRSPIGVWDKGILCAKCESLFQACDDYAQKVLRACPRELDPLYFSLRNFDYAYSSVSSSVCFGGHRLRRTNCSRRLTSAPSTRRDSAS